MFLSDYTFIVSTGSVWGHYQSPDRGHNDWTAAALWHGSQMHMRGDGVWNRPRKADYIIAVLFFPPELLPLPLRPETAWIMDQIPEIVFSLTILWSEIIQMFFFPHSLGSCQNANAHTNVR